MKAELHQHVLRVLNKFKEPVTVEEITVQLVMGDQNFDLGAMPLRAVYDCIEDAISAGGGQLPYPKSRA
jgi:hypothetical protein